MKFSPEQINSRNVIRSYESGRVQVGERFYDCPVIVTASQIVSWQRIGIQSLTPSLLAPVLSMNPEIILLGCGETRLQPSAALIGGLAEIGIGIEAMDHGAACRTFNILVGEDRNVVLALQV